jgi:DNA invertase Pin-like site-specific DNA recombinase
VKLVAYIRVSSVSQLDGFGLAVQRKNITTWARNHGHRIVAWHADEGVSGAMEATEREGLSAALLALQEPPQAAGLVVARLDRLARALTVQEAALAIVWRARGKVFTADQGEVLQDDPDDPMRTALRQIVGVFAELDRRLIVKRLKDGRQAKAAAGGHAVGVRPFGELEGEREARARICQLRSEGHSYRAIAAKLDDEGLRPRRGERWSDVSVRKVYQRATQLT